MPAPDWFHPIDFADVQRLRGVSLAARWVFVEVFAGELGSKTGLVDCRPALIAAECGLTAAQVDAALAELGNAGLLVWCRETRTAYHRGHLLRHGASNDKHAAGWRRALNGMPDGSPKSCALAELNGEAYPIDTLSIPYRYPIDTLRAQEQEQEQEQEQTTPSEGHAPVAPVPATTAPPAPAAPKRTPAARFSPPTPAEVTDAFNEKGMPAADAAREAAKLIGYYDANGWRVGKNPMRSWRGAVATWHARWAESHPGRAGRTGDLDDWRRGADAAQRSGK